ncbi:MAG: hypothetical protein R3C11_18380 [Planctomycetaceae bacterium]
MNDAGKQERLLDLLDAHLQNTLTAEQQLELENLLRDDAQAQQLYHDYLELEHSLNLHYQTGPFTNGARSSQAQQGRSETVSNRWWVALALGLLLFGSVSWVLWWQQNHPRQNLMTEGSPEQETVSVARFTQLADARFLDQSLWKMGDHISAGEEITLRSGLIELTAAGGAEVILEGPTVFEWKSPLELVLKYGRCSVHVPEQAEKIEVQTPTSRIVDLGTSFAIDVTESGESEVQLIEGMADVYHLEQADSPTPERLNQGDARQFVRDERLQSISIPFNNSTYRSQLPDRVVSYQGHDTGDGVDLLEQVTVQRGGELFTYAVEELTQIELLHFSGSINPGNLAIPLSVEEGGQQLLMPGERHRLLEDSSLATGVINPWGETVPVNDSPVMNQAHPEENSKGMAFRFLQPVVNEPGPDVVLFDLHVIVHAEEGDAFHISPLVWREGLKAHSITKFDITLSSPEAQLLVPFRLVKLNEQVFSLEQLEQTPVKESIEHIVRARGLAVGVDLSDMGYQPGEEAEGLFLQDLSDDNSFVDPVFIGGLPTMAE